ncbi:MAG: hypothetical protein LAN71_12325 [Acidobacteriia bacterium]|nr:hypothetical protein [Terriglobia bacterium]
MLIDEVIDGLQGFAGAYKKTTNLISPESSYQLKISAVKPGSLELIILAWVTLGQYPEQIKTLELATRAAKHIFDLIVELISFKKHTKGQPYNISIKGDNNTVLVANLEGQEIAYSPEILDIARERLIDSDLNKIVSPLQEKHIESVEMTAEDEGGEISKATVKADEREYFRPDASIITSKEIELIGTLISLNKETDRGMFKRGNGEGMRYKYVGENSESFHADFAYHGPVKIIGIAHFDENLTPTSLEIKSVQRLQRELPLS